MRVAREYDATAEEGGSLGEFLQQIALLADADSRQDDEGLVTLMTMHNAKGLEYPIVFMIGMEDGVFPHSRALDEGALEEERRLAYVGITRAMRDLTLTYARRRNSFGGAQSFGVALALHRRDPARADRPARARARRPADRADRLVGRRGGRLRGGDAPGHAPARSSARATTWSTPPRRGRGASAPSPAASSSSASRGTAASAS